MSGNPFTWPSDMKNLAGVATLVITILGASWGAAESIGGKIYAYAQNQTKIIESLEGIKKDVVPRVVKLESDIIETKTNAAAAKQRVDDMAENLKELKSLAQQNLTVSQSHSVDIKATRQAVAPSDAPDGLR